MMLFLIFSFIFFISCAPKPALEYKEQAKEVSVAYLKSQYRGYPVVIDQEMDLKGIVLSSDQAGNMYKVIVIEDETGAIEIKVDMKNIWETFNVGTQVMVRCNSLTLGAYGGWLQLGISTPGSKYEVDYIPEDQISSHIVKSSSAMVEVLPYEVTMLSLSARYVGCYVCFRDVQFLEYGIGLQWCESDVVTYRQVVDRDGNQITVRINPRALFANFLLPQGSGLIEGILSYFNGSYQLIILSNYYVVMESPRF